MNYSKVDLKRVNLVSEYFKKAYDNDSKVVYVNALIPSEILLGLGLVPFNMGTVGGIFAQGKAAGKLISLAEQNYFSSDLCSTSRCLVGAAHKNALPTPDFLTLTSGPCDVDAHLIHTLSQLYDKKWFAFDIPLYSKDQEAAEDYVENQIEDMIADVEETLDVKLDPQKLKTVIGYSNEAITYIKKISEFAKIVPSPLSAVESIDIISTLHLLGTKEMAEIYKEKYEEIKMNVEARKPQDSARKPRVMWHGLRPYYTNEIFEYLENTCRLEVLCEHDVVGDAYYGWDLIDPDEPYRSIAKRMLHYGDSYCSISQRFIQDLPRKLDACAVDGVIAISSRGCRHYVSLTQTYRDIFNKINRPFLEIDCDFIDYRDFSIEQLRTRIEAFSELLYRRMEI